MPPRKPNKPKAAGTALRPVRPGCGIELQYRRRLEAMTEELHASILWWVRAEYRKHPPALAQDATPFDFLRRLAAKLRNKWLKRIEDAAPRLAEYFATAAANRVDANLKRILRDSGFSIKFQHTKAMQDAQAACIHENVCLIRSIASQYLEGVEGIISRSYAAGYDLKQVTDELQDRYKISRKRAKFIANDQSKKLNSAFARQRFIESGIKTAVWRHSMAAREPRRTHLHMDGEVFDVEKGMYDPEAYRLKGGAFRGEWVQPGWLIGCKCSAIPFIPAFGVGTEENLPPRSVRVIPRKIKTRAKAKAA